MNAFRHEQRGVAIAMAAALAATIAALATAALADCNDLPTMFADRLQATLRIDVLLVIWLVAAIGNVARLRFFSETDIAGGGSGSASPSVRRANAILQNTAEQAVLAFMAHVIVTATFTRTGAVVATLAGLFTTGRALFWIGYAHGARARAFGFGLTFYPSVVAILASAAVILVG